MSLANATVMQVLIPVSDLDRGVAFYRDTLGIPFLFSAPPQMAFFSCGNVRLLVGVPPEGQKQRSAATVYLGIADIGAAFASLKAKGVGFQAEPHVVHRTGELEVWLAEFTDPDGNQLALMSERRLA